MHEKKTHIIWIVFILTLFMILASSSVVFAADISVGGNGFNDIQNGIDSAASGDHVVSSNATYHGSGDYIHVNKSNIVIRGSGGGATLDAHNLDRVLVITGSNVNLEFLTISNGNAGSGSGVGIWSNGSYLTVKDCIIKNNKVESGTGAALHPEAHHTSFINCSFINNQGIMPAADDWVEGGAIDSHANYKSIIDCYFENNRAIEAGGAVSMVAYTIGNQIINSTFKDNFAGRGGAVNCGFSNGVIFGCNFTNNRATNGSGGGIYIRGSDLNISDSRFIDNDAENNGGAIYAPCELNLTNSNFTNNIASASNGGIVYSANGKNFTNNRLTSNTGNGLIAMGNNADIGYNYFNSNSLSGILSNNIVNSDFHDNTFSNNGGSGLYFLGNNNKIYKNNFLNNNRGITSKGNNININNNDFNGNRAEAVYLIGNNSHIVNNDILNGRGNGISLTGNYNEISNNNIQQNSLSGITINGKNNQIIKNTVNNNKKYGIYSIGNNAIINSNSVTNNKLIGIYTKGNSVQIVKNNVMNNKDNGIYFIGSKSQITSNTINSNTKIAILGQGNNNNFLNNTITNNSFKKSNCAIYFKGNYNTYKNNNLVGNGYHGIHVVGNKNNILSNYLNNNKNTQIPIQGNNNNIRNNNVYNGGGSGINVIGPSNSFLNNTVSKNKDSGIILNGNLNSLKDNFAQISNIGIEVEGSKNKILQNTIRANNIGIKHKKGSSNYYNYNYIVNKRYNLYRLTGSVNAEYNWWGINNISKVKNVMVKKYVIAKLVLPKDSYLKLNKSYQISLVLRDNTNKALKSVIPSTNAAFSFSKKIGKNWTNGILSSKNLNLSKNKATVTIKTTDKYLLYYFKTRIDNQNLTKIFYPPCDLEVRIIATPNPAKEGGIVNYRVIVKNLGPGKAYNIKFTCNFSKLEGVYHSENGLMWNRLGKSFNISSLDSGKTKTIYIRGFLKYKFFGYSNAAIKISNLIPELKYKNNVYKTRLLVKKNTKPYCGPNALQLFLNNKGIFLSSKTLAEKLNLKKGMSSFYSMIKVTKDYGIKLHGVKLSVTKLKAGDIALLKIGSQGHYINIISTSKKYISFMDPTLGQLVLTKKSLINITLEKH